MSTSAPIRVAVFGARHPHVFPRVQLVKENPSAEFVGLWDPDPEIRARYAADYGYRVFDDVQSLLDLKPTLALIEGLDHQNPEIAAAAAEAGCDLLIEKPGANRLETMNEMAERVRNTKVHAQIGYMLAHSATAGLLENILQSGALGRITLARFHASSPVGCSAELWQSLPDDEGGVTYTDGCHIVDLIQRLFGTPTAAQAAIKRVAPGGTVRSQYYKADVFSGLGSAEDFEPGKLLHEDCSAVVFDYPDQLVTLDVTGWEARGWVEGWRVEIYGTNGTAYAGLTPSWVRLNLVEAVGDYAAGWTDFQPGADEVLDPAEYTLVPDQTYRREMEDLLERLGRGDRSQAGLDRGVEVVRMLRAAFDSSRAEGRSVAL